VARQQRIERALLRLAGLRERLASPRTRHRERARVAEAVEAILGETGTEGEIAVTIEERSEETFAQQRRGRPNAQTLYVKSERKRFELTCRVDSVRLAEEARCDGIFPLITDEMMMSARDLLLAYKERPMIEKRFAQLKTDFVVAPVLLEEVSRIQALLCVYFLALLVGALLEREPRRAMEREGIASLPIYPEARGCRRPTARKVIDLFEDVQRHELSAGRRPAVVFTTKLNRLQRRILRLLGMPRAYRG
jgi:transposase